MNFLVLTLFPEMLKTPLSESILKRAQEEEKISVQLKNIRDFGEGKRKNVDDAPFGGGAGMVMSPEVLADALRWAKKKIPDAKIVFLTPHGERFTQKKAMQFAEEQTPLILLCGHFEGIDHRIREMFVDEEISLGDFVLTGGEIPALALIDAVSRLIPGVLGNEESHEEESFSLKFGGRMEYPQYTRPEEFEGMRVPEVLLSGNHAEIKKWRESHIEGFSQREFELFHLAKTSFSPKKPWKAKNFLLRTQLSSDVEHFVKWMNDAEVAEFTLYDPPYSYEDEEERYEEEIINFQGLFLTIVDRITGIPIGKTAFELQEYNEYVASFSIMIGEKGLWGKGLGTAVVCEMQKIGFELLHLEKISIDAFEENAPARSLYEKCGFYPVGARQNHVQKKNGMHNIFLYELMKSEWQEMQDHSKETKEILKFRGNFDLGE
ncbi:tRNA (guanosine(37)-N1)-methyltransferase TrmD [Candidatus Peregrinibacteria bacterium]|nr:tRNA (guanosine(37)-N1)-methyltransferase TrmD [Candidatus Peregrinibacteria bacterium]